MNSMKKLGIMCKIGPIWHHLVAYLGFRIPKTCNIEEGFIGACNTADSYNPTKLLPQNCVLLLAVHGIIHNTGITCKQKTVLANMLSGQ